MFCTNLLRLYTFCRICYDKNVKNRRKTIDVKEGRCWLIMANNTNDSRQTYEEQKQRIYELTEQLKSHENREYKSRLFSFILIRGIV